MVLRWSAGVAIANEGASNLATLKGKLILLAGNTISTFFRKIVLQDNFTGRLR
jgi:hypothetical protein